MNKEMNKDVSEMNKEDVSVGTLTAIGVRCMPSQRPRTDADRGGSWSRCSSLRFATGGLLLP